MPGDKAEAGLLATTAARPCPSSTRWWRDHREGAGAAQGEVPQGFLDVPEIERPTPGVDFRATCRTTPTRAALFDARASSFR
jgi:hypothetical protein